MNKRIRTVRTNRISRRIAITLGALLLAACVLSCGSFRINSAAAEGVYVDQPIVEDRPIPSLENMEVEDDFAELFEVNNDLVGWLTVGDVVDLPVTQYDNTYYLDHDFYGKEDQAGTVFINEANIIWPQDRNLLFHGHNMKSGAVFGNLDEYRKLDYLKENPIISFRTIFDPAPSMYVPIALFDASMNPGSNGYFDIGRITFKDEDDFLSFANDCIAHSMYNVPFTVEKDDNLITLITCSYSNDNGRFIMVCRGLHMDELNPEVVKEKMQSATAK